MLTHSRRLVFRAALLAAAFLATAPAAFTQSQSINGTIRGRASDPSGASIGAATVTIANSALGVTRTTQTASDGYYTFINLPLGTYTVSFTAPGFSTLNVKAVELNAGTEAVVDGGLKIGSSGTDTEVTVTAENTGVDPTNLNIQRTLDNREVENLPLTSRNPYNFILFQPGVSGHPNAELGIPRTINTNGLLDRINYQMDGMVNTQSDRYGLRLFPIGNIFVKEVQTVSNPSAPEYGWTAGDVYNVISNSGTNAYHGLFQYLRRWQDATAYPLLTNKATTPVKPNLQLDDYSANAGGRIVKDKLFFFGSYEHLNRGIPAPVTISPANAAAIGIGADQLVTAPGLLHGTLVDARLDWNISSRNQAFLRYNYFRNAFPFNTQVGGINTRSTGADYRDRAHVFGAQLITTLSPHLLNELRASIPLRANEHFASVPTNGPAIVITNIAAFGASSNVGDQYTEKQPSGSDNISYVRGAHNIKAGFLLSQIEQRQRLLSFSRYTFATIGAYQQALNGTNPRAYTLFESQQDPNGLGYASLSYGAFAQDTWQLTPKLVAVYGLRYDRFSSPKANAAALYPDSRRFNVPKTNFAPRLGFTYRATPSTILKASAGIFYETVPTNLWFNALNLDGSNRTGSFSYSPTQAGSPAFPNIPSATGNVPVQNPTTVSPAFKNEYTWNINAQISQEFSSHDSLTIGYIMANGRNLMYQRNVNLINPIGTLADGRPVFSTAVSAATRADPRFNQVNEVFSGANSSFNALLFSYTLRPVHGLQLNANYTWSHTISDSPEVNTFEQSLPISDTTNLKRDRGNSVVNRPNAFNLTAVLEPQIRFTNPFARVAANGNRLAILANLSSGDQANILASTPTLNGDASTGSVGRPAFVGRNTARGFAVCQVDARYTRTFPSLFERIEPSFLIEANNLFNHNNLTGLSTTQPVQPFIVGGTAARNANAGISVGAPTRVRTTVLEARIVQFGFAARF